MSARVLTGTLLVLHSLCLFVPDFVPQSTFSELHCGHEISCTLHSRHIHITCKSRLHLIHLAKGFHLQCYYSSSVLLFIFSAIIHLQCYYRLHCGLTKTTILLSETFRSQTGNSFTYASMSRLHNMLSTILSISSNIGTNWSKNIAMQCQHHRPSQFTFERKLLPDPRIMPKCRFDHSSVFAQQF